MRATFRPPTTTSTNRPAEPVVSLDAARPSRPPWLFPAAVGGAVLLLLGAVLIARLARGNGGTPVGPYGIRLGRGWLAFATQHAEWLGDPIWSERAYEGRDHCVGFVYAIACRTDRPGTRGTLYAYELVDLGRRALPPELSPQPGLPPPPIVQARFDEMERAGVDWHYWYGLILSPVFCVGSGDSNGGGECLAYTTTQVLRWPRGTADPRDVRPTPLGLQAPHP